jgi:hypothetical protein
MALHIHRLDTNRHKHLFAERRKDPLTQEPLRAGDEVVFCARCQSAFLVESWKYLNGKHGRCKQPQTLREIPGERPVRLEHEPRSVKTEPTRSQPIGRYFLAALAVLLVVAGGVWVTLSHNDEGGILELPPRQASAPSVDSIDERRTNGLITATPETQKIVRPRAEILPVRVPARAVVNQPIFIDVTVVNTGADANGGGISISFPDNPYVSIMSSDTTRENVYPVGSQIWSKREQDKIFSRHILAEAWQEPWNANETHHFRLKVTPVRSGTLRVYVRATVRVTPPGSNRRIIETPESGRLDQQGFPVKEYTVRVTH